ncbi:hypothetical protein [Streptomyces sp. VRA16 Mangrove soil]|uniref:hypothetical protein n=1 Tax=Streptomyces sp. VRA16 Mangrove soil TaxID=2817434 RepID=UPI001A9CDA85|nr:hypothetical protein [Streptomyces sp. VRA16 Mangrove soil]MBO1332547.1 hypothetical protein [Streptomyces sp. VRA16 Mangrove soil]
MGYDMYSATEPDPQQAAAIQEAAEHVEELRCQYMNTASGPAATALEDQLNAAWNAYDKARTGLYFRLNIWGMGTARQLMGALDMMTDAPMPPWPALETYDLTEYPDAPEHHPTGPERDAAHTRLTDQERAFLDTERATRDHDPQTPGIPAYKLTSNDGWLVSEREIKTALDAWDKTDPADQKQVRCEFPWWDEWLEFLRYNSKRGGFRVY